jgi:hypothetical protein
MTEPDPLLDEERRFEGKADWVYVHGLSDRIRDLELDKAARDAVSAVRRWAVPIILSTVGLLATVFTVAINLSRK